MNWDLIQSILTLIITAVIIPFANNYINLLKEFAVLKSRLATLEQEKMNLALKQESNAKLLMQIDKNVGIVEEHIKHLKELINDIKENM